MVYSSLLKDDSGDYLSLHNSNRETNSLKIVFELIYLLLVYHAYGVDVYYHCHMLDDYQHHLLKKRSNKCSK